jgi:hypothetical protein
MYTCADLHAGSCLCICLSIHHVCLSVFLSVYLLVCLSVCLSTCLYVCMSVSLSVSLFDMYMSACRLITPSKSVIHRCLSVCPSVCLATSNAKTHAPRRAMSSHSFVCAEQIPIGTHLSETLWVCIHSYLMMGERLSWISTGS